MANERPDPFESARALFIEGVALFEAGRHADAEQRLEASLALLPGRVSTLINLGAARLALGRPADALAALDAVIAAEPQHADAWCHRGSACSELGRDDEALASFDRALALDGGNGAARYQRALSLARLGRHAEALPALETLLRDEPERSRAWMLHGQTLQSLGRHAEATASYQRAVAIEPGLGPAWSHLGQLLKDLGRVDDAASAFERAIAGGADAEMNRYFLAGLSGRGAPAATPRSYVRALFDSYADDFESHLVQVLRYRAHEAVVQAAQALQRGPLQSALDLGCGTGLCGPLLKALAARVEGVDLSPTMLARARARGVYDELAEAEIAEHLQATPRRHDLVVAADVLIYVGDVAAVFAGVRRVLNRGGVFAFSIEAAADDEANGFVLRSSLRYAHSEHYVRAQAHGHGFELLALRRTPLREEQRQPIEGLIVCLGAA